jgi:hypothetical protein
MSKQTLIDEALQILADLGLPPAQRNERSALTLLALIDAGIALYTVRLQQRQATGRDLINCLGAVNRARRLVRIATN